MADMYCLHSLCTLPSNTIHLHCYGTSRSDLGLGWSQGNLGRDLNMLRFFISLIDYYKINRSNQSYFSLIEFEHFSPHLLPFPGLQRETTTELPSLEKCSGRTTTPMSD